MIRIIIADDHQLLLEGLSQALGQLPDIEVAGTAADGKELLGLVEATDPDVVVLDQDMPRLSGLGALKRLDGSVPAVMVTMHADEDHRLTVGVNIVLQHAGIDISSGDQFEVKGDVRTFTTKLVDFDR